LGVAGGHSSLGAGGLLALSFVRQGPQFSYGFDSTVASGKYLQLGNKPDTPAPSLINQLFVGYSVEDYGSFSMSYTLINSRNFTENYGISSTPSARLLTGTYTRSVLKNISLTVGFVGDLRHSHTNQAFIGMVFAPDNAHIVSNYASQQNHQFTDAIQLTKSVPLGTGYGYDIIASNNSSRYAGANLTLQNEIGSYTARLGQGQRQTNYELDASGSAIYFAGDGFLARKLTHSFAVVQIPHYPNVEVFYQHQLMGHTDRNGNLLVTELLPYQENLLEIVPATLPLDTKITVTEKTIIPYFHSGVLVQFPVKHLQGAIAHLLTLHHQFVPVGAEVTLQGDPEQTDFMVGYEGTLYIPEVVNQTLHGTVRWNNNECHCILNLPKTTAAIIELGNVLCY